MESHPRRYAVNEYSEGVPHAAQEVNMIRNFSEIVTSRKLDPTWGDIALKTQIALDACLQSAREGEESFRWLSSKFQISSSKLNGVIRERRRLAGIGVLISEHGTGNLEPNVWTELAGIAVLNLEHGT